MAGITKTDIMMNKIVPFWVATLMFVSSMELELPGKFLLDGNPLPIKVVGSVDVYETFAPHCARLISNEVCLEVMDEISYSLYGVAYYTPSRPLRTLEDSTTSRGDVVKYILETFNYSTYLEIGCDKDQVFSKMRKLVKVAVGVDVFHGGTVRMTSDDFFAANDEQFELIFIDGDHDARQAIKDVMNALHVLLPGGTIVMHDCNPRFETRKIADNGDVWKVLVYLRTRQDVEVVTIDLDHGVAVVRKRPNLHPLAAELERRALQPANPIEAFTYVDLDLHRNEMLRLVSLTEFRSWLNEDVQIVL